MPLESLPDRFDPATHQELDSAVQSYVEDDIGDVPDLNSGPEYRDLLHAIIETSNGDLDTKYLGRQEAKQLFNTHGELREMLRSAWKHKSFREIRNLAILKAPLPILEPPAPEPLLQSDLARGLSGSFEAKYRGAAVDGFYEFLTHNEKLFNKSKAEKDADQYYAKFCSIVQSSGTGKSRMLTELRKKSVIVIYMNMREEHDVKGFPARDPIPSNLLTKFPSTVEAYQTICYAFLIALFDTLEKYLSSNYTTRNSKAGIMRWVDQMCDMSHPPRSTARIEFFRKLAERYGKTHADLTQSLPRQPSTTDEAASSTGTSGTTNGATDAQVEVAETEVEKTTEKLQTLSLSESARKPHPLVSPYFSAVLSAAYEKVGARLASIFPDAPYHPKLVIAIDEAHPLCTSIQGTQGYRPADVLCRAVSDYTHVENHSVWVVFASTTSKVADFSPPNQKYNSDRVAIQGEQLFPPYTQLGWDQSALGLGEVGVEDVSRLDHVLGYGRPLWVSLRTAHKKTLKVLDTASWKLYGPGRLDTGNTNHVLAILGQRFGLNVTLGHPDSIEHLEKGVASHLRICLATTLDRNWRFTSYPSEPLLSCVAATDLHAKPETLGAALATLLKTINSGMIDMGQRGELASRLLFLLSKDMFIRTRAKNVVTELPRTWEGHLADCQMIPVVDWLEFVFGSQIWDEKNAQTSLVRQTFEDAYLNFSHWVCMDANIAGSKEGNELILDEWTLRHWQRTSAVQCCHQQPLIDKVIPIYFKGGPETASAKSRMSQILISDKARESKGSKDALHDITRRSDHPSSSGTQHDFDSLPYIAILADLGQPPSFSATFPERDVADRCLRIYAAGVNTTTYPFLGDYPGLMNTVQNLVHLQQIPETERPYTEYLNAQVKFGSTATPEHMLWEHGRDVPNVRGTSARQV